MESIPIVDLGKLSDIDVNETLQTIDDSWIHLSKDVRKITGEIGFMQLINHGVPDSVISKVFDQSKSFFDLQNDVKIKYAKPEISTMDSYYGYTKPGQENLNFHGKAIFEYRETYDWLEGRGVYPDKELPVFESSINELHEHCKSLAKRVLRIWAIGLGIEDVDFFIKKHKHWIDPKNFTGLTNMRLAYYPSIPENMDLPPDCVRIHEHVDLVTISFVFQDETGGLEVKNSEGKWLQVPPIPGAIVCNTGDLLEFWTSGLFSATPHRVLIPDIEIKKRIPRYSIAYFSGPDEKEIVTPLEIIKTPEEKQRLSKSTKSYSSEPIIAQEYTFRVLNKAYDSAYNKQ